MNHSHERVLETLAAFPLGNMLIRPSKRFNVLLAYLKVRETHPQDLDVQGVQVEHCFRLFDVKEVHKETDQFGSELGSDLLVEGMSYRSVDEIIACHMDPIMENLRLLQEHPRFGIRENNT